jgi:hypothetical protein
VLKPKSLPLFPNLFNLNTKIKFIFQQFWFSNGRYSLSFNRWKLQWFQMLQMLEVNEKLALCEVIKRGDGHELKLPSEAKAIHRCSTHVSYMIQCKNTPGQLRFSEITIEVALTLTLSVLVSSKLQVPILKDQKLENLTTSRYSILNPKKQQHQGRANVKGKARDGQKPNNWGTSGGSGRSSCLNDEQDTSDIYHICQRQLMEAAVELTEM